MLKIIGGRIYDPLFSRTRRFVFRESMSTAMVRIYTPEGFVIAADGFPSGTEQKIYPASGASYSLAFGVVGWAGVHDDELGWHICLTEESQQAAAKLAQMNLDNISEYAETFAQNVGRQVTQKIAQVRSEGKISEDDYAFLQEAPKDCSIHFAGYFKNVPQMVVAEIEFDLPESTVKLAQPPQRCDPYLSFLFGSRKIRELLSGSTEPVIGETLEILRAKKHIWQKYRTPNLVSLIRKQEMSLHQAAEAANDYIEACKDPEAIKIDRKACEEIAGEVHIASITPSKGFDWLVPPKTSE